MYDNKSRYEILKKIDFMQVGVFGENYLRINVIKWNGNSIPKIDLRVWRKNNIPCDGFTMNISELIQLRNTFSETLLNDLPKTPIRYLNYYAGKMAIILKHYGQIPSIFDWPIEVCLIKIKNSGYYDIRRWKDFDNDYDHFASGLYFEGNRFEAFQYMLRKACDTILSEPIIVNVETYQNIKDKRLQEIYEKGLLLENGGKADEDNLKLARGYFEIAAKENHAGAMCHLGHFYEVGLGGVKQNFKLALDYYEKAAEAGSANALFALGQIYEEGKLGILQDRLKAELKYEAATKLGNVEAEFRYKLLINN